MKLKYSSIHILRKEIGIIVVIYMCYFRSYMHWPRFQCLGNWIGNSTGDCTGNCIGNCISNCSGNCTDKCKDNCSGNCIGNSMIHVTSVLSKSSSLYFFLYFSLKLNALFSITIGRSFTEHHTKLSAGLLLLMLLLLLLLLSSLI